MMKIIQNKKNILLFICFLFVVSGCNIFTKKTSNYLTDYKNQEDFLENYEYFKDLAVEKLDIANIEKDTIKLDYCTIKGNEINFSISNYSTIRNVKYLFASYLNEYDALDITNIEIDTVSQRFIIVLLPKICPSDIFKLTTNRTQKEYVPLMYNIQHKFTLSLPNCLTREYAIYKYLGDTCFHKHPIMLEVYSNYQLYIRLGVFHLPTRFDHVGYLHWRDEEHYQEYLKFYIPYILYEIELNSSAEILFEK